MSVLAYVFDTLQAASLLQLLLAFVTGIGYALGQGALLDRRSRRWAWSLALLGAVAFAWMSPDWMRAAVILAFAVAGMGLFTAAVWLLSRFLGEAQRSVDPEVAEAAPAAVAAGPAARKRASRASLHST